MGHAVFLDRDGVLNERVWRDGALGVPSSVSAVVLRPGVREALERLRAAGFLLIVVTNQPEVARGTVRREDVEAIHAWMLATLSLDAIEVCWHDDGDGCACRKPRPGLLLAAAAANAIRLDRGSYLIGDRWRDVGAGRAAGCTTILVNPIQDDQKTLQSNPDVRLADLPAAAAWILAR